MARQGGGRVGEGDVGWPVPFAGILPHDLRDEVHGLRNRANVVVFQGRLRRGVFNRLVQPAGLVDQSQVQGLLSRVDASPGHLFHRLGQLRAPAFYDVSLEDLVDVLHVALEQGPLVVVEGPTAGEDIGAGAPLVGDPVDAELVPHAFGHQLAARDADGGRDGGPVGEDRVGPAGNVIASAGRNVAHGDDEGLAGLDLPRGVENHLAGGG